MTILTHVLLTTLGVKILNLSGNEVIYAYTFGVLPDIDHIVKIPSFIRDNGLKPVRHYPWRTFMQEPVMLPFVGLFGVIAGSWIPPVFFISHLFLDYLIPYEKMPFKPFLDYKTKGFLTNISGVRKELATIIIIIFAFVAI